MGVFKVVAIFSLIFFAGCETTPKYTRVAVVPPESEAFSLAKMNAATCDHPAVAPKGLDVKFRYGCFCGAGWPNIGKPSSKPFADWSAAEQSGYIEAYYLIKPIDDIDAACQAHDLCWSINGNSALACNIHLYASLDQMRKIWNSQHAWLDNDRVEARCESLALDMAIATNQVMEFYDSDSVVRSSLKAGRAVSSPISVFEALTLFTFGRIGFYPREGERCFVNTSK